MNTLVLLAHAGATCAMTGLIWFVQAVHYPLFDRVGAEGFAAYETAHAARTTLVVAPLMLVELATAAWLALAAPAPNRTLGWLGLALLGVIWLSTFALQVPQHDALARGFETRAHTILVGTNWIRTVAWTLRSALALWMLGPAGPLPSGVGGGPAARGW